MQTNSQLLMLALGTALCILSAPGSAASKTLTLHDVFPTNRVLDIQLTLDDEDWDTLRNQSRTFNTALHGSRKLTPIESPYTYFDAMVTIDGKAFGNVGVRKKGFLGSLSRSRPSLKVKLNHVTKENHIEGLTNLTLNNNLQDESLLSQFMGYGLFNAAGSPAPRCAYAKVTVNGRNLGVYSHVETVRKSMLKRSFGNDQGTLYEGPYVDFYDGWVGSFDHKLGKDKRGRKKINQLIRTLTNKHENMPERISKLVNLDAFYTFWALEGLLGFWDGYSGNNNNYFIYLEPGSETFHFLPWGADSLFTNLSKLEHMNDRGAPISVKTQGLLAHTLYQLESGRQRYAKTLIELIEKHWNEEQLLTETKRIESMVRPHMVESQLFAKNESEGKGTFDYAIQSARDFIRRRRSEITEEIANGMPEWEKIPHMPFVTQNRSAQRDNKNRNAILHAVRTGKLQTLKDELANGGDINARDRDFGVTPLAWSALLGHTQITEHLLNSGVDVNSRSRDSGTALHAAAFLGHADTVQLLIEHGAHVNATDDDGETPLHATRVDWETTEFVANLLKIEVTKEKVQTGRNEIRTILQRAN